jgi:hypothetical protein
VSNIDRPGRTTGGAPPASVSLGPSTSAAPRPIAPTPGERATSADMPSAAGTAVLNLTTEQRARIRLLLIAMRMGSAVAGDVRNQIFALLTGGQRRNIGAAWFILSVRA